MKKENILILALPRHDEKYNSTSWQLATEFAAKGHQVFYVDHAFTWFDFIKGFYKTSLLLALVNTLFPRFKVVKGVNVMPPTLFIPINFLSYGTLYRLYNTGNQRRLARVLNKALVKWGATRYILVNSFDFYLNEMDRHLIGPKKFIYHCIDPMVKDYTKKHGERQELEIAGKSDFVICTAPMLHERFQKLGIKSYLVPNAANLKLCSQALLAETPGLASIAALDGPVLGYLGNIERRIDYPLLQNVINHLPGWHVVLVGPVEKKYVPESFLNHPNIHLMDPVGVDQVPSVLKVFDVAMIPFKRDEVSRGIYPLKLYEYLGAGLPVVSTNFNPDILSGFDASVLTVAEDAEAFAKAVTHANDHNSGDLRKFRHEVASEHTWEHRANEFLGVIANQ